MAKQTNKKSRFDLLEWGNPKELSKFKEKTRDKILSESVNQSSSEGIKLISVEELAVLFGLSPKTIRKWIALRKIPCVKIGRRYLFQEKSIKKWLNQKETPYQF